MGCERNGESLVLGMAYRQKAAAGDSAAFGLLVEEHTPWLLVRLTRRLGSHEPKWQKTSYKRRLLLRTSESGCSSLSRIQSGGRIGCFLAGFGAARSLDQRFGAWLCSLLTDQYKARYLPWQLDTL